MSQNALTPDELRHLLRRIGFTSLPSHVPILAGRSTDAVLDAVLAAPAEPLDVPLPASPDRWHNEALRHVGMSTAEFDAAVAGQAATFAADREVLQQWWLQRLLRGNGLRERMALFLQSRFGSASALVMSAPALGLRAQRLRRLALGSVPALLQELIVDPATMIQIGMDGHGLDRVSDRPAKLVLDRWTVGAGGYAAQDVEDLSRALTGWRLVAAAGAEPVRAVDPTARLAARRTGLTPLFDASQHDDGEKTLLGVSGHLDARAAIDILARHPLTARRFAIDLLAELGLVAPSDMLVQQLQAVYQQTDGAIVAMLRAAVRADEFWRPVQRWSCIKTPVQLAIGACTQLQLAAPPLALLSRWVSAAGQPLFDTPDNGERSWPAGAGWLEPAELLALRYQLPNVLAGVYPPAGLTPPAASAMPALPLPPMPRLLASEWLARLDPAPGLEQEIRALQGRGPSAQHVVSRIIGSAQYQLA